MTPEDVVKNSIMIKAGELGYVTLRLNSGRAWNGNVVTTPNGVVVCKARSINLCPKGTSDLEIIMDSGKVAFVECKAGKGKPTEDQTRFIDKMKSLGHIAGVCWSVDDFLKLIKG